MSLSTVTSRAEDVPPEQVGLDELLTLTEWDLKKTFLSPPGGLSWVDSVPPPWLLPFPPTIHCGSSLIAQLVKNLPGMQETPVQFVGQEDLVEKG